MHTRQAQSGQLADIAQAAVFRTVFHIRCDRRQELFVGVAKIIRFFRNRHRHHLEGWRGENLREAVKFRIHFYGFGNRTDNLLLEEAVCVKCYRNGQVVIGAVETVDNLVVICFAADDTGVGQPDGQQTLRQNSRKGAEDIACADVQPGWGSFGALPHGGNIVGRNAVSEPVHFFFQTLQRQFHVFHQSFL